MYLPFDISQIFREIIPWKCIYLLISARFLEKLLRGNVSTFWFQPDFWRNWSPCCRHERTDEQKQTQVRWKENCCFDCRGPHLPLTNVQFWSKCRTSERLPTSAKYLGVRLNETPSMKEQVTSLCHSSVFHLRKIASIRPSSQTQAWPSYLASIRPSSQTQAWPSYFASIRT